MIIQENEKSIKLCTTGYCYVYIYKKANGEWAVAHNYPAHVRLYVFSLKQKRFVKLPILSIKHREGTSIYDNLQKKYTENVVYSILPGRYIFILVHQRTSEAPVFYIKLTSEKVEAEYIGLLPKQVSVVFLVKREVAEQILLKELRELLEKMAPHIYQQAFQ